MAGASKRVSILFAPVAGVILGILIAWSIRSAMGVHIPLLVAAMAGIVLGFLDPKKGWIASLIQALVLIAGVLVGRQGVALPEIEMHSLIGAVGLTFTGSFIGAFIMRAFIS